jgi:dipeptidyl aminopeptidase/acylaminoacyl peptidase
MSWSQDGKYLVFWVQDPKNAGDIWVYSFEEKKASRLIATESNETHPQISPDGKWISYTANDKDHRNEIYIQPFPTGNDRYQISNDGGDWSRWRGDSKELFYQSLGIPATPGLSQGATAYTALLFSSSIDVKGPVLEAGLPRQVTIFPVINIPHSGGSYYHYAVDPTGKRFLAAQFVTSTAGTLSTQIGPDTFSGLTVVLNWRAAPKK